MTNPSNAVEKPATGCGCLTEVDRSELCPVGQRLYDALRESHVRYLEAHAGGPIAHAWLYYKDAQDAYRTHIEASNE